MLLLRAVGQVGVSAGGEGGDKAEHQQNFYTLSGANIQKNMTLHPFGDNFTEQREKYTLSGVIYCVKKGSKGERSAIIWEGYPTLWGEVPNNVRETRSALR